MANRFIRPRFLKWAVALLAAFALSAAAFQGAVNRWLAAHEGQLRGELTRSLGERASFMRVRYTIWDGVLVENFKFGRNWAPRVQLKPGIWIARRPGLEWRVVLHRAKFTLRADAPAVARLARQLASSPVTSFAVGSVHVPVRLASFEIRDSTGTLVSPDDRRPWRQEFEGLRVFFGAHLLGGEKLVFQGHVAGKPEAWFRIRARVLGAGRRTTETSVRFDCRRFTTAYLKPHLRGDFRFPDEDLTASVKVKFVRGRAFSSEGRLALPKRLEGRHPLLRVLKVLSPDIRYRFQARLERDRARLTQVVLKSAGMRFTGGGDVSFTAGGGLAYDVRLESSRIPLARLRPAMPDWRLDSGDVGLSLAASGTSEKASPSFGVTFFDCALGDRAGRLRVSKLDGRVWFGQGRLAVDDVWAFVNDFPVGLKGEASLPGGRVLAELSTYPGQVPALRVRNPLNADVRLEAARENGRWNGVLRLKRFVLDKNVPRAFERSVAFRGLRARLPVAEDDPASFGFETLVARGGSGDEARRFVLRRGTASLHPEHRRLRARARGSLAGGSFKGEGSIALRRTGPWEGSATLAGVRARPLLLALGIETPLEGALNGTLAGSGTIAKPAVEGKLFMGSGSFGPHPGLLRLEEKTGIALERIGFRRAAADFVWRPGALDVARASADGPDARLAASFKLREPGRLAGTLSARFPEHAIRRSSQLAWLMRFVGGKGWIDFDFKVAGTTAAPRIQWLGGEFKRKVEKGLAPWMRQVLSRELEKRMAGETA